MVDAPAHLLRRQASDNHRHLVCRDCGRTEDVDCVAGEPSCLDPPGEQSCPDPPGEQSCPDPPGEHGFLIDEAEVIFWGLCPTCRAAPRQPSPSQHSPHYQY